MTFDIQVLALLGDEWVDVTCNDENARVLGRDKITITRGRSDWSSDTQPARCTFSLLNTDGRYSARNPNSPYYGSLGRNTPVRILVDGYVRFVGEVSEWPVRADSDIYVPVEASGILRRISKADPLGSVIYRALTGQSQGETPVAYWPLEDGSEADRPGSALATVAPMTVSRNSSEDVSYASFDGFAGSAPTLTIPDNVIVYGNTPAFQASGESVTVMALVSLPEGGVANNNTHLMTLNTQGTTAYWRVRVNINGTLSIEWTDGDAASSASIPTTWNILDQPSLITFTMEQNGANIDWTLTAYRAGSTAPVSFSATALGRTFVRVWRVVFGAQRNLGGVAVGHIAVFGPNTLSSIGMDLVNGYSGEAAGRRIERLCLEEDIPFSALGPLDETQPCGPQKPKQLIQLLQDAADVDAGYLYEPLEVTRALGQFESGTTDGFVGDGTTTVSLSTVQVFAGSNSLRILWQTSDTTFAGRSNLTIFIPGVLYTLSCWVFVPTGDVAVRLELGDGNFSAPSTVTNQWQKLSVIAQVPTATSTARVRPVSTPASGDRVYIDEMIVTTEAPGLAYRTLASTLNRDETLILDFDQKQVAFPLEPTYDDQSLANDVGVTREGGSTQRWTVETGPLSVQPPPNGVGRYSQDYTRVVETDTQASQLAAWLGHLGTWDEHRIPEVSVNLRRHPTLIPTAALCEPGLRVKAINPPLWLPPEDIDQIIQGSSESIDINEWDLTFNTTPSRVNRVMVLDDDDRSRLDSANSTLENAITSSATSMVVRIGPTVLDGVKGTALGQGTSFTAFYLIATDADATDIVIGDVVRLYNPEGVLKEGRTFEVVAKNSAFGFTNIEYDPDSFAGTYAGDTMKAFWALPGAAWTRSASDLPMLVELLDERTSIGEVISVPVGGVSAITGTNGTQTFSSVTRGVNGIQKAWPAGTKVRVYDAHVLSYIGGD